MKLTARDVAAAVGTSVAAVSRAFRPEAPIAPALREAILRTAADLGYQSPIHRALSRITTNTVTLVAADLENPFYPMAANALSRELAARGRRMVLHAVPPQAEVDAVMDQVLAFRSDAVVVTSSLMSSRIARACREAHMPAVLFNRVQPDACMTAVTCDNYSGGRMVAHRFLTTSRRRLALIGGRQDTSTHLERRRGFIDVLESAGQELIGSPSGRYDYATSLAAARELLGMRPAPDAIFCINDLMALAALDAARDLKMRVPDDVAIIGFDDVAMASWASYRLTTVRQPLERMAAEAVDLIEAQLAHTTAEGTIRVVPVTLVERDSG
ncbi:LacI family DNA-binding transcriptional regulator [Paracoccus sp. 22332]|uniref:LacI family DNA-binding transcriptional regulator n=1 Tax=Paracoccus sp. 22332 TaxID=3453913 RepID=UPI003F8389EE